MSLKVSTASLQLNYRRKKKKSNSFWLMTRMLMSATTLIRALMTPLKTMMMRMTPSRSAWRLSRENSKNKSARSWRR